MRYWVPYAVKIRDGFVIEAPSPAEARKKAWQKVHRKNRATWKRTAESSGERYRSYWAWVEQGTPKEATI